LFGSKNGKHDVQKRVEEIAEDIGDDLKDLGRSAREGADDVKKQVVRQLYDTAKSMRKEARERGAKGDTLKNVNNMAKGLERAATYLKWNSYEDIGEDVEEKVTKTVTRNPLQMMLILFAIGLVIGLVMRNNQSRQNPPATP